MPTGSVLVLLQKNRLESTQGKNNCLEEAPGFPAFLIKLLFFTGNMLRVG
ncbi:hypothetical protein BH23BAC1_BH23BAC1_36530 [soil metagenome]